MFNSHNISGIIVFIAGEFCLQPYIGPPQPRHLRTIRGLECLNSLVVYIN
jgi:hypothetical protein